jgi:hypothetical protein
MWVAGPGSGIVMPTGIGRDELEELTGQLAQLVEVLPASDYDWARLPGAVNIPLKELDARAGQLDRSRPVIVSAQPRPCIVTQAVRAAMSDACLALLPSHHLGGRRGHRRRIQPPEPSGLP